MAVIYLRKHPEISASFRGIDWLTYRVAANITPAAYIEANWNCKVAGDPSAGFALHFATDEEAVAFMLRRPWENVP